jgi:hypothetical protein
MLLCILISCTFAFGQSAATSLRGVVKDPAGAMVAGATVTIADKASDKTLTTTSNGTGYYQFPQIPPARYVITVTSTGFAAQSKEAELLVNQPATIDFKLSVEANSVTVDVTASAQTLNTTDATMGNSVGNETIQALPMEGRDPVSLLTLQPGVLYLGNPSENDTNDTRSGSVNGGRSDQGNITLDGLDDNDQIGGAAFTGVLRSTLDSTEEFRVTTSNGNADSGRSSGAQVSLVTKAGTNRFHGGLYEYYRPTNTVANQWFNKYQELVLGEPNVPQKYVLNTFGAAIGGPIKKDKLFFFANYEGKRQAVNEVITRTLPTQQFYSGELGYQDSNGATNYLTSAQVTALDSGCSTNVVCGPNQNVLNYFGPLATAKMFGTAPTAGDGVNNAGFIFASPAPLTQNTSIVKIDYDLTAHQRLFVRGNFQKDTSSGAENLPGQPASSRTEDNTKGIAVGHTWNPTSNLVNDARFAYVRQGYGTRGVGSGKGDWVSFRFLSQPESQTLSTIVNVPVENVTDNLTWTVKSHTLNFGGNWRGIENNRGTDSNSYSGASTNPYWLAGSPPEPTDPTTGNSLVGAGFGNSYLIAYDTLVGTVPSTTQQFNYSVTNANSGAEFADGTFINRHFKANEFEYYLQDSWQVKPNLTITLASDTPFSRLPMRPKASRLPPPWIRTHGSRSGDLPQPPGRSSRTFSPSRPAGRPTDVPDTGPSRS